MHGLVEHRGMWDRMQHIFYKFIYDDLFVGGCGLYLFIAIQLFGICYNVLFDAGCCCN
jgi:hypothetical protein